MVSQGRLHDSIIRIGIDSIGPTTVEKMVGQGIDDLIGVLRFSEDNALKLDGFAEKSAEKLVYEISKVRRSQMEDPEGQNTC